MRIERGDPVTAHAKFTGTCECGTVLDVRSLDEWAERHKCPGKVEFKEIGR